MLSIQGADEVADAVNGIEFDADTKDFDPL